MEVSATILARHLRTPDCIEALEKVAAMTCDDEGGECVCAEIQLARDVLVRIKKEGQ